VGWPVPTSGTIVKIITWPARAMTVCVGDKDASRAHGKLKARETKFPLDDGEAAAPHDEKPAWLP